MSSHTVTPSCAWMALELEQGLKWLRADLALGPPSVIELGRGLLSRVSAWGRGVQPMHEDEILAVVTSGASGDGVQSIDVSMVELTCVPSPSDVVGSFFTLIA